MFSNSYTNFQGGSGSYQGRGRGGRGRGRPSKGEENVENNQKHKKDRSKLICWRCDKPGHFASSCPEKQTRSQEVNLNETHEADALYIHEVVFLNEDSVDPKKFNINKGDASVWYLDNGASNHMTGNKEFFASLDEGVKGTVRFGDGSTVDIEGKGTIFFECKTGEQRALKDIYLIPDLKHNILSLGQATENGCEVIMRGNLLTLKDPCGRLLVQVTRSPNRLYMTPMKIGNQKCLQIQDGEESWRWDSRLGHVSFGVMNNMVRKEMVIGMPQVIHEKKGEEGRVYKLYKALYGLRQAPRAWNIKLDQVLKEIGFRRCLKEPSVYRKEHKTEFLIVAIYVDDLFVTGSSLVVIKQFKEDMSRRFEMSDLGKLTYYLGIEVIQGVDGIWMKQEGYAQGILVKSGMDSCNLTHVPMESGLKLSKAEHEPEIDATEYRRIIGCLRYLLHTRPDLSFAVGILSRYMHSPRSSHGQAIKHILRYVKGTTNFGIFFKKGGSKKIIGYCDSSHNIDVDDGRSTTGHVFYFDSSPITWTSQKQPTVALSSCEAEFMAATEAAKQAIWLKEMLSEILSTSSEKTLLRIDNKSAIALTKNPVFHGRSKHILAKYHFIRECVEDGHIEVEHIPGVEQKADILTKPLARIKFKSMRDLIGVQEFKLPKVQVGIKGEIVG